MSCGGRSPGAICCSARGSPWARSSSPPARWEALNLSLQAVTRPGDTVAIESPAFYACLQSIEAAGLKAVEIPTHPREGVDLAALEQAIGKHNIRACWFMTSFHNPLGATLPAQKKRELVKLLAGHEIPLIEDDVRRR